MRQERPPHRQNWTKQTGDQLSHTRHQAGKFKNSKNSDNQPSNFKGKSLMMYMFN